MPGPEVSLDKSRRDGPVIQCGLLTPPGLLIYGSWVDGASIWLVALYLAVFLGLLAIGLFLVNRRNAQELVGRQPTSAS